MRYAPDLFTTILQSLNSSLLSMVLAEGPYIRVLCVHASDMQCFCIQLGLTMQCNAELTLPNLSPLISVFLN